MTDQENDNNTTYHITKTELEEIIHKGVKAGIAAVTHFQELSKQKKDEIINNFNICQPRLFRGDEEPIQVFHWIEEMESVLGICTSPMT